MVPDGLRRLQTVETLVVHEGQVGVPSLRAQVLKVMVVVEVLMALAVQVDHLALHDQLHQESSSHLLIVVLGLRVEMLSHAFEKDLVLHFGAS